MSRIDALRLALVLGLAVGCSPLDRSNKPSARRPERSAYPSAVEEGETSPLANTRLETLNLHDAQRLAGRHPKIVRARHLVDAAKGRATSAGLWANPQVGATVEALPINGGGGEEIIIGVQQAVPISGSRSEAQAAATAKVLQLQHQLDATTQRVLSDVRSAFYKAYVSHSINAKLGELAAVAEDQLRITQRRVELGDLARSALAQAELSATQAQLRRAESEAAAEQATLALAAKIGTPDLVIGKMIIEPVGNVVDGLDGLADVTELVHAARTHPDARAALARITGLEHELRSRQRRRIPDVTVRAAYRHLSNPGVDAIDIGFSIPLPVFNRQQGAVVETSAQLAAARSGHTLTRVRLESEIQRLYAGASRAHKAKKAFEKTILPRARELVASFEESARQGDASRADVLEARTALLQLDIAGLEALLDFEQIRAELEYVTSVSRDE